MPNLAERYKETLIAEGFHFDREQEKAVTALQRLLKDLLKPKPFFSLKKKVPVQGVYLHGGVGRGKSMLMDLFFDELLEKSKNSKKQRLHRRVHFHEFMIETHDWLHQNRGRHMDGLLPAYARHVSKNIHVLCFDEFHVTDVAGAMILGRLFTALFEQGVVVVSTSNWAPDNLYEGGLQRDLFLPFIELLKQCMEIIHLDSDTDYRQISDPDQDVYYFSPLNQETEQKVQKLFEELSEGHKVSEEKISVKGRSIDVVAAGNLARFTFAELCEKPLGAEDYITISKNYDTVFLENIPVLSAEKRNEAKRLILLIDCLYEAHCRLVLSAEADIYGLYEGEDHAFEFDRTVSRLMEMQSYDYHEKRVHDKGCGIEEREDVS